MADDQFEGREQRFNQSLGGHMGSFALAMTEADAKSKDFSVDRLERELGKPNVKSHVAVKVPGGELSLDLDVPALAFAPLEPLVTERAHMTMDMETHAAESDSTSVSAEAEAGGEASFGFGLFKGSAHFSASSSVSKEHSRSSDYTAKTHAELTMVQGETPEGVMIVSDAINDIVKAGVEMSKRSALAKAEELTTGGGDVGAGDSGDAPAAE